MAIKTGDNFLYRGRKPLDSRDSFSTILQMTTFAESSLDDGHISYVKETDKYYKFNSTNEVDTTLGKWREYNGGGGSSTDEKVKLDATATDAKYLNELIDNATIEVDTTNNCLVVKKIEGQTATVAEINFLTGVKSNIQAQIDNLGKSMTMYGVFGTKADLIASTTPTPVDGNTAIVIADEDNDNKQMTYIYIESTSAWTQVAESSVTVRDFTTKPINLATETTGTLHKSKIDTAIARLADVLDKTTYRGTGDGIVKQADKLTGLTATIAALNQAVTDSHAHSNKAVLDKIVSNGIGSGFLADNGKYISILHIDVTSPLYDSQIWIDNTDNTKPILKIYDGTDWIAISSDSAGKSAYEIAVDNGFVGTETEWLESLKGSVGDKGDNGTTPHIDETTKNWFIGDVDTGILAQGANGKDGKSISTITKDDDDNIIVTFTDGSTQNIGKLSVNIQGDFLTSDGFGNIRYYNDKFQYYNASTSTWVDIEATTDNKLIVDLTPQPMQKIQLLSDIDNKCYKIVFKEPEDTIVNGQLLVAVEGIKFVRKLNSAPIDINDGELVLDYTRRNFGKYGHKTYLDTNFSPVAGENWYYKAFPYSSNGMINNSSANVANCIFKDYYLYGFKLNQAESDPASMITYLDDCDNVYFEPAYMDYNTNSFNYGDWGDAWFIKNLKPCMLKYDGTVDYELDKNDYTKKTDGTDSDVANASYGGNAMVGIPKVYWKIINNGDNTANIYFSDKQVDTDFHCWSHIDNNGNEIDYCYMPIYNGSNVNGVLRSISGKAPMASKTATTEITYAKSNNTGSDIIWYTELFNDRMLINLLLLLIGKSTDTQTVFGAGNNNSYVSNSNTGIKNTGTMNTKGLFWGNQDNKSGVKVFGMEHWYGNIWRRIGGWINDKGTQKIKMTYGQSDGSTTDGYNETGSGYISIGGATPSGTNSGYISKMLITDNGLIPTIASGSATTYYCDGLLFNNSQVDYACVGGRSDNASRAGAFCSYLNGATSNTSVTIGSALSCKPLATT